MYIPENIENKISFHEAVETMGHLCELLKTTEIDNTDWVSILVVSKRMKSAEVIMELINQYFDKIKIHIGEKEE